MLNEGQRAHLRGWHWQARMATVEEVPVLQAAAVALSRLRHGLSSGSRAGPRNDERYMVRTFAMVSAEAILLAKERRRRRGALPRAYRVRGPQDRNLPTHVV